MAVSFGWLCFTFNTPLKDRKEEMSHSFLELRDTDLGIWLSSKVQAGSPIPSKTLYWIIKSVLTTSHNVNTQLNRCKIKTRESWFSWQLA